MIAPAGFAQFASGVSLVEVYATVSDSRGQPVSGLGADDFIVEEDGQRQTVQAFTAGNVPLSLAIGVDRSFSMSRERLAHVTSGVQRLLGDLRPVDQVMLLAIGSDVETLAPLSVDHRSAYDALLDLQPWGTTPLFDATVSAIDTIQKGTGRRALILITDGSDRYSTTGAAEAVAYARTHDVLVYPVALRPAQPPVFVELANVTGGRSFAVGDVLAIPSTLSAIARELREQYLLGYTPRAGDPARAGWRSISVRVTRPGLRVRARDGYVAR